MATHSNVLAWRIPGTGESGGLPSMGSHRVGHDCRDLAAVVAAAGDKSSIRGLGRSHGEGNGNPLQYAGLENRMDRGTWWATVHGVAKRVGHDLVTKQQQPGAKTPHSQYRQPEFDPWSGS